MQKREFLNKADEKARVDLFKVIITILLVVFIVCVVVSNITYNNLKKTNDRLYTENSELKFQNDILSKDIKTAKYKVGDIVQVEFGGVITELRHELCRIVGVKRKGCGIYYSTSSLVDGGYGAEIEEDRIVPGKYKETEVNMKVKKYIPIEE